MQNKTKYLLIAIMAFIAGIACEYVFMTDLWPNRHQTYTWIYALRNHKKPGEPCKTDQVLDRQGYSLGYSYKYKTALWVSYILSSGSIGVPGERYGSFSTDQDIPEEYRAKPEDFANTGYDKGHLAPSATIDFSPKANQQTFILSNVVLQEPSLNRQGWEKIESLERDWTKTKGKLYVVTGPLFSARPQKVNGLSIPAQFYKVIYAYSAAKAIGFILPNKPVTKEDAWKYALSVQEVEKETGLTFFSKFSAKTQQKLKETLDLAWWQQE